tara:strand:- start:593 stop:1441 length:849 start_codon:yes stop_codon:yes gene_type:complete
MVIFVKSYPKDFSRLDVLLRSIEDYNIDNIPVYICIDKVNKDIFHNMINSEGFNVIYSEDIVSQYSDEEMYKLKDMSRWHIQQILKFEFCKNVSESENVLIVDSDSIFIRPFYINEFFDEDNNLFTIVREVKKQIEWYAKDVPHLDIGIDDQAQMMAFSRKKIQKKIERVGDVYDFGPPAILWSKLVVQDFCDNYLLNNNLSFADIINEVPIEYNWYGEWLLKSKVIPFVPKEPIFKNIFWADQYHTLIKNNISKLDLADSYMGLNLQTSFSKDIGVLDYEL